jgi:hypothetical protein
MSKIAEVSTPVSIPEPKPALVLPLADQLKLDEIIVSCATAKWCKIALLISQVTEAAKAVSFDVGPQSIAARVYVLADIGKLLVQGNVRRWRSGEVKRA